MRNPEYSPLQVEGDLPKGRVGKITAKLQVFRSIFPY